MRAVVVILTYDERKSLEPLVEKILQYANDLHILIDDDNSPDGTEEIAEELHRKHPEKLFVLHREKKKDWEEPTWMGLITSYNKGYEFVLQMDADLSHDPIYLPVFLEQIRNYHLVLGSRYLHGIRIMNWDFKRPIRLIAKNIRSLRFRSHFTIEAVANQK